MESAYLSSLGPHDDPFCFSDSSYFPTERGELGGGKGGGMKRKRATPRKINRIMAYTSETPRDDAIIQWRFFFTMRQITRSIIIYSTREMAVNLPRAQASA